MHRIGSWRGGPPFDLAGGGDTEGAPSFSQFAKGGSLECGHQKANTSGADRIATRPCKERKDGAPPIVLLHASDSEDGPATEA
jgi:hypothetical protein